MLQLENSEPMLQEPMLDDLSWATAARLRYEIDHHPELDKYNRWKAKYPGVLDKFKELAMQCVDAKKHFGMWLIANRLRWEYFWSYNDEFKISNDYTALITRELMLEYPQIKAFCRIKRMTWADHFEDVPDQLKLF